MSSVTIAVIDDEDEAEEELDVVLVAVADAVADKIAVEVIDVITVPATVADRHADCVDDRLIVAVTVLDTVAVDDAVAVAVAVVELVVVLDADVVAVAVSDEDVESVGDILVVTVTVLDTLPNTDDDHLTVKEPTDEGVLVEAGVADIVTEEFDVDVIDPVTDMVAVEKPVDVAAVDIDTVTVPDLPLAVDEVETLAVIAADLVDDTVVLPDAHDAVPLVVALRHAVPESENECVNAGVADILTDAVTDRDAPVVDDTLGLLVALHDVCVENEACEDVGDGVDFELSDAETDAVDEGVFDDDRDTRGEVVVVCVALLEIESDTVIVTDDVPARDAEAVKQAERAPLTDEVTLGDAEAAGDVLDDCVDVPRVDTVGSIDTLEVKDAEFEGRFESVT